MMAKPWLEHYDPGVPKTLEPYPQITLLDHVRETAQQRPDHIALIFKGERISYGELEWRSDALAQALIANGVKKGDRVAMIMPNTPQFVIARVCHLEGRRHCRCRSTLCTPRRNSSMRSRSAAPRSRSS